MDLFSSIRGTSFKIPVKYNYPQNAYLSGGGPTGNPGGGTAAASARSSGMLTFDTEKTSCGSGLMTIPAGILV